MNTEKIYIEVIVFILGIGLFVGIVGRMVYRSGYNAADKARSDVEFTSVIKSMNDFCESTSTDHTLTIHYQGNMHKLICEE